MRILIANATMATRTGTETYVRDLALGLMHRGHEPSVYAPELGEIARELQHANIPVVDDFRKLSTTPDVIHGNHNTELLSALLHFSDVPAVFFCHSATDWNSSPPDHPRIVAYVAVDEACRDRLTREHGIPDDDVRVCLHGVDQQRFKPRPPLPDEPRRALVFSNSANGFTHLAHVQQACDGAGISLDVVGWSSNSANSTPETLLGNYDLVFAKARCALESLVVGSAVILCDARGSGPMVNTRELDQLRRLNFGLRALSQPTSADVLLREIARYDAADAAEVSRRVRAVADLCAVIDEAISVYQQAVEVYARSERPNPLDEARATADYLRWLTLTTRKNEDVLQRMLGNSATLRVRNALGRFAPLDWPLRRLGRFARRREKKGQR